MVIGMKLSFLTNLSFLWGREMTVRSEVEEFGDKNLIEDISTITEDKD